MKKFLLIAMLLFAFGTVLAQTGRDTATTGKNKGKSGVKAKQESTAQPSTTLDQNKQSSKNDNKTNKAVRTNTNEPRDPEGTTRNEKDRNPSGTAPAGSITEPLPGSTSTPSGTMTPAPGSMTPK